VQQSLTVTGIENAPSPLVLTWRVEGFCPTIVVVTVSGVLGVVWPRTVSFWRT